MGHYANVRNQSDVHRHGRDCSVHVQYFNLHAQRNDVPKRNDGSDVRDRRQRVSLRLHDAALRVAPSLHGQRAQRDVRSHVYEYLHAGAKVVCQWWSRDVRRGYERLSFVWRAGRVRSARELRGSLRWRLLPVRWRFGLHRHHRTDVLRLRAGNLREGRDDWLQFPDVDSNVHERCVRGRRGQGDVLHECLHAGQRQTMCCRRRRADVPGRPNHRLHKMGEHLDLWNQPGVHRRRPVLVLRNDHVVLRCLRGRPRKRRGQLRGMRDSVPHRVWLLRGSVRLHPVHAERLQLKPFGVNGVQTH